MIKVKRKLNSKFNKLEPKIKKAIKIIKPLLSRNNLILSYLEGRRANKTLEPSKGGIEIKLKTIKTIFTIIKINKKVSNKLPGPKLA